MKLGLKEKLQKIIDAYKANMTSQQEEIKAILEPCKNPSYVSRFTQEGIVETIKEQSDVVNGNWKKFDMTLNQQVKEVIASAKESIMKALGLKADAQKPADYATRIANAREFLKDELSAFPADSTIGADGAEELDDTMHTILKDFIDDYDTMKLFRKMVQRKISNFIGADGECIFPKTFGKLNKIDSILNTLDEMNATAEMVFLYSRYTENYVTINNVFYGFPIDPYSEDMAEQNLLDGATILDDYADHMDSDGQEVVDVR